MDSNIVAFLKTRKFWDRIITFVLIISIWLIPQFGVDIPTEVLVMITTFLLVLSSWVIRGDIKFDLETLGQARERVINIENAVDDLAEQIIQST